MRKTNIQELVAVTLNWGENVAIERAKINPGSSLHRGAGERPVFIDYHIATRDVTASSTHFPCDKSYHYVWPSCRINILQRLATCLLFFLLFLLPPPPPALPPPPHLAPHPVAF